MRILLDECIDWRLGRVFVGHDVRTVPQMGWAGIKNGKLLALATGQFEVFVTVDRNLSMQQNLSDLKIALVVLRSPSNRHADLKPRAEKAVSLLGQCRPGSVLVVEL